MTVLDIIIRLDHVEELINILEDKDEELTLTSKEAMALDIFHDYRAMLKHLKIKEQ